MVLRAAYGKSWIDFTPPLPTLRQTWELADDATASGLMKNIRSNPLSSLGGILMAALWLLTASTQAATPGAAEVKKVVGTATYTDGQGGGPIKEGQVLLAGATITTGAGSYVDLDLKVNGNALRVEADTTLSLNKLEYTKAIDTVVNTQVEVTKGAAVANVINKLSKASKYEIKTTAGIAGIRGTVVRAGPVRITCLIGTIQFVPTAGGGVNIIITGGNAFSPGTLQTVRAGAAETTGLARSATQLTANAAAASVASVVQQFTAALAADAATEAAKAGGDVGNTAANSAKAAIAELLQAVQQAAAESTNPQVKAAIQAVAQNLTQNSESISASAAATGAGIAVKVTGGTDAQAQAQARSAASSVSTSQTVVNQAVTQANPTITQAQPNQNPTVIVDNRPSPGAGPTPPPGGQPNQQTQPPPVTIFVSPGAAGVSGTTTTTTTPK